MVETTHSTIVSLAHHRRRRAFRLALAMLAAAPFAVGAVSPVHAELDPKDLSQARSSQRAQKGFRGPNGKTNSGRKGNHYGGSDPSKGGRARTGPGGGAVGGL